MISASRQITLEGSKEVRSKKVFSNFLILVKETLLKAVCCFSMLWTNMKLAHSIGQAHKCRMMLRSIFN